MSTIVATLPKLDLYCSLLGAPAHDQLSALLAEANDARAAAEVVQCGDVAGLEAVLADVAGLLRRPGQVEAVAYALAQRLLRECVVHAEIHIDPLRPALDPAAVFDAVDRAFERAIEESDDALLSWVILAEARRGDDAGRWLEAFRALATAAGDRLVGVALTGDESVASTAMRDTVAMIGGEGLKVVVTAGYGGRGRSAADAKALDPARIIHGHSLLRDEEAMLVLRARRVPVVSLPALEQRIGMVRANGAPTLPRLLEAGAFATVATGVTGLFGTTMTSELEALSISMGWRLDQMRNSTARAVEAAFIHPKLRYVVGRAVENWRHRPRLTGGNVDDGYGM